MGKSNITEDTTMTFSSLDAGSNETQSKREFAGMIPDQFFKVSAASESEARKAMIEEMIRRLREEDEELLIMI